MAKMDKLTVGQTLWSVERGRMGNTTMRTQNLYSSRVVELDPDGKWALISWNGNPPRRQYDVSRLRVKKPVMVHSAMGYSRLATRAELKAMKDKKEVA